MKKKLEADLISIAHRILKLKNKSELEQLYLETGKLYEKLSVLRYVEMHFSDAKPTIGHAEVSDKLAIVFESEEETPEFDAAKEEFEVPVEVISEENNESKETEIETTEEEISEETKDTKEENSDEVGQEQEIPEAEQVNSVEEEAEAADEEHEIQETEETETSEKEEDSESEKESEHFKPSFELSFERKEVQEDKKSPQQISFDDLLGHDYTETVFEKVDDKKKKGQASEEKAEEIEPEPESIKEEEKVGEAPVQGMGIDKSEYEKPAALNEIHGKAITFGLNDRIGFEKNLFGGSSEDMNRVISQLNTFNSFQEAQDFIEDMVKPDYNNWDNKDDYAQRFMEIVEKKFS